MSVLLPRADRISEEDTLEPDSKEDCPWLPSLLPSCDIALLFSTVEIPRLGTQADRSKEPKAETQESRVG